jgi:hypothetical protein
MHEQPLPPELDGYRADYRRAREQARDLVHGLDEDAFNRRPSEKLWSVAECLEHLNAWGRTCLPGIDEAIRLGRERDLLGHGPFTYGRLSLWFVRQAGGDERPPSLRFPSPSLYAPERRTYDLDLTVSEFLDLQEAWEERLQLASGLDLARIRAPSPVLSLLRLPLGLWFRLAAGHQRRHLGQARRAREALGL